MRDEKDVEKVERASDRGQSWRVVSCRVDVIGDWRQTRKRSETMSPEGAHISLWKSESGLCLLMLNEQHRIENLGRIEVRR